MGSCINLVVSIQGSRLYVHGQQGKREVLRLDPVKVEGHSGCRSFLRVDLPETLGMSLPSLHEDIRNALGEFLYACATQEVGVRISLTLTL